MKRFIATMFLFSSMFVTTAIAAQTLNNELKKCAEISRDLLRLDCYDRLSGKASSYPAEAYKAKTVGAPSASNQAVNNKVAATVAPVASDPRKTTDTNVDSFGKVKRTDTLDEISSYIPGKFTGWKNGDQIQLANGQIWEITDTEGRLSHKATDPRVTISKGLFGSYRIKVKGLNKSARVKRIK